MEFALLFKVLGAIGGFFSGALPKVFETLQDRADKKHELEMVKLQFEIAKSNAAANMEMAALQADSQVRTQLYQTYHVGIKIVDAITGLVRPVFAYAFFAAYAAIKFAKWQGGLPVVDLWDDFDQMIFAGIVSFFFGKMATTK